MELKVNTVIDREKCIGCGKCEKVCLYRVISTADKKAIISGSECFNCGHCKAACPTGAITVTTLQKPEFSTFLMDETWSVPGTGKLDTAELVRLMASLRSCRNFSDKPVERKIIEDLVNIGTLAPSGSNQQEWSFTILESKEVQVLAGYTAEFVRSIHRLTGITPLRKLVTLAGYKEAQQYYYRYNREFRRCLDEWDSTGRDFVFYNAPRAIIIGVSREIGTPAEDAMLASHNIRLAAHTMGLGTCYCGIAVRAIKAQRSIARKMGLPPDEDIYAIIGLGWPTNDERYVRTIERKRVIPRYLKA